jgi:hypothetical protein
MSKNFNNATLAMTVQTKPTSSTLAVGDTGKLLLANSGSAVAWTLPTIASTAGRIFTVRNLGAGDLTITRGGSDLFASGGTSVVIKQGGWADIISDGTAWQVFGTYWTATASGFVTGSDGAIVNAGPFTKVFESAQTTLAFKTTFTHGLGVSPKLVQVSLVCTTADNGYAIGDELSIAGGTQSTGNNAGSDAGIAWNATNVIYNFCGGITYASNAATPIEAVLTLASFKLICRAYA